jgi:hypothetical protein
VERDAKRLADARDAAVARVRRVTVGVVVACLGSTVAFAGLAAGSTHLRKVTVPRRAVPRRSVRKPLHAPAPPLVAVAGADQGGGAAPPAPAPAPTPATQAPVVVSGGS